MVHFVGAGPGAPDLITVRGKELIEKADIIIYAGSLVNPALLEYAKENVQIYNSAEMTLEEVTAVYIEAAKTEKAEQKEIEVVRLHTGEPSIYGAIKEQMDFLEKEGIPYDSCPGVSACFGAAASLNLEYTLPGVSQTLIITRLQGKTLVPETESMESLAAHKASMAIYLSAGMLRELSEKLLAGGYEEDTPAAIVYKATWPEEKKIITTVGKLAEIGEKAGIKNIAVVLVGDAVSSEDYEKSRLYSADFTTGFRTGK